MQKKQTHTDTKTVAQTNSSISQQISSEKSNESE